MATQSIYSIGKTCALLQRSPGDIAKGFAALGIEPVVRQNGIPYFNEADIERLREHLAKQRAASNPAAMLDPLSPAILSQALAGNRLYFNGGARHG